MRKRLMSLMLGLLLICFSGCVRIGIYLEDAQEFQPEPQIAAAPRIAFSKNEMVTAEVTYALSDFDEWEGETSQYRGSILFDTLDDTYKRIYHAMEFAMENGYIGIMVEDEAAGTAQALKTVLELLALDSPLLEQNLRYSFGTFSFDLSQGVVVESDIDTDFSGYYIMVHNFQESYWEKKQEAITKAEQIVSELEEDLTQVEKAEQLYLYAAKNITYDDKRYDDGNAVYSYLYDGLVEGRTHCDGISNSLALLLSVAGIPNVEKIYSKAGEAGHTWNMLQLDGVWYNADATASSMIPKKPSFIGPGTGFGFPDMLLTYPMEHAELYAACTEGLYMSVDAELDSIADNLFLYAANPAFSAHSKQWALIVVEAFEPESVEEQIQMLADERKMHICYFAAQLTDGRTAVYIFDGSLFES